MPSENSPFRTLAYVSLYFKELDEAVAFYSSVLGAPTETHEGDEGNYIGWEIGDTWLTFFAGKHNPRSTEFAIQVSSADLVDELYDAFLESGATTCRAPSDTWMYRRMRFACVKDPFGAIVDLVFHLPDA
jgi:catechol 2,3-dioxygenase-like lactoylglutathione lyase family enzyme